MEAFALHDGDLELTAPTLGDVDRITELCQQDDIQRWTTVPSPYTRQHAEDFVTGMVAPGWQRGSPVWAIRQHGQLAGMVGLTCTDGGSAEIGYWLGADHRGTGVMHRACRLALDVAFGQLDRVRVEWRADVGNWASWRVAWRLGFRKEGQVRGLGYSHGRRVDQWIGTLLRDDARHPVAPWDGPSRGAAGNLGPADGRDPYALVRQFHEVFDVPLARGGARLPAERTGLRMALVGEELAELVTAVYGDLAGQTVEEALRQAEAVDDGARDVVAAADALGDLVYVVYGMANECDIPLPEVLAEIHRANLSKLGADGRPVLREDGKVLKGPDYRPPDVAAVLEAHRGARH